MWTNVALVVILLLLLFNTFMEVRAHGMPMLMPMAQPVSAMPAAVSSFVESSAYASRENFGDKKDIVDEHMLKHQQSRVKLQRLPPGLVAQNRMSESNSWSMEPLG